MCKLVSRDDYVSSVAQLTDASDVKNILDFILHVCRSPNPTGTVNIRRRARQLMLKVVTKAPVIPELLVVTGITMPAEHDYIARGGFGHVFKGELRGNNVALKVLYYKADNNVVSHIVSQRHWLISVQTDFLSRSSDVGIPQSRIRVRVFRNIPR